jgi:hypothetical protein
MYLDEADNHNDSGVVRLLRIGLFGTETRIGITSEDWAAVVIALAMRR